LCREISLEKGNRSRALKDVNARLIKNYVWKILCLQKPSRIPFKAKVGGKFQDHLNNQTINGHHDEITFGLSVLIPLIYYSWANF